MNRRKKKRDRKERKRKRRERVGRPKSENTPIINIDEMMAKMEEKKKNRKPLLLRLGYVQGHGICDKCGEKYKVGFVGRKTGKIYCEICANRNVSGTDDKIGISYKYIYNKFGDKILEKFKNRISTKTFCLEMDGEKVKLSRKRSKLKRLCEKIRDIKDIKWLKEEERITE